MAQDTYFVDLGHGNSLFFNSTVQQISWIFLPDCPPTRNLLCHKGLELPPPQSLTIQLMLSVSAIDAYAAYY